MNRIAYFVVLTGLMCLLVSSGCAPEPQAMSVDPLCVNNFSKLQAVSTAQVVLSEMHFPIAKVDVESGYVGTKPLPGAQFFEIWRGETVGAFNAAESNLHTTRRIVEVNVEESQEQLCLRCTVHVQRLHVSGYKAGRQTTEYEGFRGHRVGASTLSIELGDMKTQWMDLGTDPELEKALLERIEKKLADKDGGTT